MSIANGKCHFGKLILLCYKAHYGIHPKLTSLLYKDMQNITTNRLAAKDESVREDSKV